MRNFLVGLVLSLVLGVGSAAWLWQRATLEIEALQGDLPKIDTAGTWRPKLKTRVLAADGRLLAEIFSENRELLPLSAMPKALLQATIASEDRRFYEHPGFSPLDIGRAALADLRNKRFTQGASTITQQLARDLYLSSERTLKRKVREALVAIELERRYSKQELLELYLNQINYGKGSYGCRTAARLYFGREPWELSVAQCAALSAIPRRPASYNLYDDPKGGLKRRNQVLEKLCEQGYLTRAAADQAKAEPFEVKPYATPQATTGLAPYFTAAAIKELVELVGEQKVYTGGLTVKTSVDLSLQAVADAAVRAAVARAEHDGATQGAAVLLDVRTGRILALCGGTDWARSQFNRATQAKRQPGSAFKPIVYAAAVDYGLKPTDTIADEPLVIKLGNGEEWKPKNYDDRWHGQVTLLQALTQSYNIPAVRLLQRVGISTAIGYAQRLGIKSPLRPVLPLALGACEVSLLELTSAYSAFAGGGARVEPTTLVEVTDSSGKLLWRHQPFAQSALSPTVAGTMVDMLREVMNTGTGKPASFGGPHGGKTGTTNDNRDAWFIGFTPELAAGVWLGDDQNKPMRSVFGGTVCGPAWRTLMQAAVKQRGGPGQWVAGGHDGSVTTTSGPAITIHGDGTSVTVMVCPTTGLLANPFCPHTESRTVPAEQAPRVKCALHTAAAPALRLDEPVLPTPPESPNESGKPEKPKPDEEGIKLTPAE